MNPVIFPRFIASPFPLRHCELSYTVIARSEATKQSLVVLSRVIARPKRGEGRSNLIIVCYEIATATSWPRNDALIVSLRAGAKRRRSNLFVVVKRDCHARLRRTRNDREESISADSQWQGRINFDGLAMTGNNQFRWARNAQKILKSIDDLHSVLIKKPICCKVHTHDRDVRH
ncbi:MAG: hypothetical protein ACP5TY_01330 [Thermodesulforhabdaceae bacterium]